MIAGVRDFVARVHRAAYAVVAVHSRARLAIQERVTRLAAVAEQTVVAQGIAGRVIAGVRDFVARVQRAAYAVIAIRRRTGETAAGAIGRFKAVAEQSIITRRQAVGHRRIRHDNTNAAGSIGGVGVGSRDRIPGSYLQHTRTVNQAQQNRACKHA